MSRSTADHHVMYTSREGMTAPRSAPWQPMVSTAAVEYSAAPQSRMTTRSPTPRYDRRAQRTPSRPPMYRHDSRHAPTEYTRENDSIRFIDEQPRFRPPPVCYSCGVPGHISGFCNQRMNTWYGQPSEFSRPSERPHGVPWPAHASSGYDKHTEDEGSHQIDRG
ncbi:hypothetical protein HPB49_009679 [Dermacentor silvarum]|uniref:Uncharacterized protein n=1 Tax=Dermacentor silvarum TaxID=543639 RepID=A0ACB8D4G2_DERSI|nr:hypothetical protein HPB49_009679 [Dermacentor silvarum]